MAAPPCSSLFLLSLATLVVVLSPAVTAQSAPAPAPSGPINITAILEKAGQYNTFIRFLNVSQAGNQINNQVNNSHDGMTVFAPTDNAFNNLPAGTLNDLDDQQQIQLVLYHICPKYYSVSDLQTVSNPVRTQASGQDNKVFGLYFKGGQGSQVNVSTGVVDVPIYNALRKDSPLAVYQVDQVLIPKEFSEAKAPAGSPPSSSPKSGGSGRSPGGSNATAPSTSNPGNGAGKMGVGFGLVSAIWLVCMALF